MLAEEIGLRAVRSSSTAYPWNLTIYEGMRMVAMRRRENGKWRPRMCASSMHGVPHYPDGFATWEEAAVYTYRFAVEDDLRATPAEIIHAAAMLQRIEEAMGKPEGEDRHEMG